MRRIRAHIAERHRPDRFVEAALWNNSELGQSRHWGREAGRRRKKGRRWGGRSRGRRYSPIARRDAGMERSYRRETGLSYLAGMLVARRPPFLPRPADREQRGAKLSRAAVMASTSKHQPPRT